MKIAVLRESRPFERRVALVPESCQKLIKAGFTVGVDPGAGARAGYSDDAYRESGATVESSAEDLVRSAEFLLTVNPPDDNADNARNVIAWINDGTFVLGSLMPLRN